MALRTLSRGFPAGLLRQASPAAGFRLMGTRCQAKETQVLASERHQLLRQQFTDLQEKTSRDLERLMKSANNLRKAGDAFLGATILGVPLLLVMGSKDQA